MPEDLHGLLWCEEVYPWTMDSRTDFHVLDRGTMTVFLIFFATVALSSKMSQPDMTTIWKIFSQYINL